LLAITVPPHPVEKGPSVWAAMLEGIHYLLKHRALILLLSVPSFLSLLGLPFVILMPVFARDLLKVGASGLGYLMAGAGIGAVISALTLAAQGRIQRRINFIVVSAALFSLALILMSQTKSFWLAFSLLIVLGATMVGALSLTNSTLQVTTPPEFRGRIMSMYNLSVIGLSPLGSLLAGAIAEALGVRFALTLGGTVCLAYFLILLLFLPRLRRSASMHKQDFGVRE